MEVLADRVELTAELPQKQRRIVRVGGPRVRPQPGKLPVDVDSVEETCSGAGPARLGKPPAGREIPLDEHVDAGGDELHSPSGRRCDV